MGLRALPLLPLVLAPVLALSAPAWAAGLRVNYPAGAHETTAARIFVIGSAPADEPVTIDGAIVARSKRGNFAPEVPLKLGENTIVVQAGAEHVTLHVLRKPLFPAPPTGAHFEAGSLYPATDVAVAQNEPIRLSAIAPPGARVSVRLGRHEIRLLPQPPAAELPPNSAGLIEQNAPILRPDITRYAATLPLSEAGDFGRPVYTIALAGQTAHASATGRLSVLDPDSPEVITVAVPEAITRTGPSSDHSRCTPLPAGTRAAVTGETGGWLRLDSGVWIARKETRTLPGAIAPQAILRSVGFAEDGLWSRFRFPLSQPVPFTVEEGDDAVRLTLFDTTAQTDLYRFGDDPLISRVDWQQRAPGQVCYTFHLKHPQPWGYTAAYDGSTLVFSLRHPPTAAHPSAGLQPSDLTFVVDPGHGGPDDSGTISPGPELEKDVTLAIGMQVRDALVRRGVHVVLTRERDMSLGLAERQAIIANAAPTLSMSLHCNALPDGGDVQHHEGVGTFWYQPQAAGLAAFMHDALTRRLNRPSYGIFWDNLALCRPSAAPAILIEMGFLIHPDEAEWLTDPASQQALAQAIADSAIDWALGAAGRMPSPQP